MKKIKVITDSTADLPKYIVEKYEIEVLPLLVSFGEESYRDGIDITIKPFLEKMKSTGVFPGTSQVNPQRFLECYTKYIEEGYQIISIHLSSKMSGTYQSACIAKEMLGTDNIVVIDSLNVTSGLGILVMKACQLVEKAVPLKEIEQKIIETIPHVKSALAFDNLDNLVKGGRLTKTTGIIGNFLDIKPIVEVAHGEMNVMEKARGNKKAIKIILDYIDKLGIEKDDPVVLLNVDTEDTVTVLRENLTIREIEYVEAQVGCVVGTHAGYGACGIFFVEKQ